MATNGTSNGTQHVPHDSALSVGSNDAVRVKELENEVHVLAEKASNASQRFADYENEIRVLQAQLRQQQRRTAAADKDANGDGSQASTQPEKPGISRFGSFMHSRKPSPVQQNGALQPPSMRENELESALVKEQTLRIAAEKKVKEVNAEIEELSASLFQQANEMVATERKENAMLKEKLEWLESQATNRSRPSDTENLMRENAKLKDRLRALEQRDVDRKRRLERLEAAQKRIERVKAMLMPP